MELLFPSFDDPFFKLLKNRKSCRNFSDQKLSIETISEILWSAFGLVRPEKKMYTAPAARNIHNISIFAAMSDGVYYYQQDIHKLQLLVNKDIRKLTGEQDFVGTAPLELIFISNPINPNPFTENKLSYYEYESIGHMSQNIYLYCAYKNLATVVRGLFNAELLADELNLDVQKVLLIQSVGHFASR